MYVSIYLYTYTHIYIIYRSIFLLFLCRVESLSIVASCAAPLYLNTDTVTLPSLSGGKGGPTAVPFTFRARAEEVRE